MKILYVEDNEISVRVMRKIAGYLGYEFLTTTYIAQGYEMVKEHRPDVIFTDMQLPDGWGYDLIGKLRSEGVITPIIGVSGIPDYGEKALAAGGNKFITRPFEVDTIMALLKSYAG